MSDGYLKCRQSMWWPANYLTKKYSALPVDSAHENKSYTFGRVSEHNVVVTCIPKGKYGLTSTISVAKDMLLTTSQGLVYKTQENALVAYKRASVL